MVGNKSSPHGSLVPRCPLATRLALPNCVLVGGLYKNTSPLKPFGPTAGVILLCDPSRRCCDLAFEQKTPRVFCSRAHRRRILI
jgi:hypothetical protein